MRGTLRAELGDASRGWRRGLAARGTRDRGECEQGAEESTHGGGGVGGFQRNAS
jgi:hypothetical protein